MVCTWLKNDAKVSEIRRYFEKRSNVDQPRPKLVIKSNHLPSQELVLADQKVQNSASVNSSRRGHVQGVICFESNTSLSELPTIEKYLPSKICLNGKRKANPNEIEIELLKSKYLRLDTVLAP